LEEQAVEMSRWLHYFLEFVGIMVAAAVAYGITKAKIARMERDIEEIQLNLGGAMSIEDCKESQEACQSHLCTKIDDLGTVVSNSISNNTSKWQQVATILGAICAKLNIPLPNWK
jgi:hypothetical protein